MDLYQRHVILLDNTFELTSLSMPELSGDQIAMTSYLVIQ